MPRPTWRALARARASIAAASAGEAAAGGEGDGRCGAARDVGMAMAAASRGSSPATCADVSTSRALRNARNAESEGFSAALALSLLDIHAQVHGRIQPSSHDKHKLEHFPALQQPTVQPGIVRSLRRQH